MLSSLIAVIISAIALTITLGDVITSTKVSQGKPTDIKKHNYQALIKVENPVHWCGGVIIKLDVVLSTHHCAKNNLKDTTVYAGNTKFLDGQSMNVSKVILHEKFNATTLHDNIAIFFLEGSFTSSSKLKRIRISELFDELAPEGTITGWGEPWVNGNMSRELRSASVTILSSDKCKRIETLLDEGKQFCSFNPETLRYALSGDMGGPLVMDEVLVGLITEAPECKDQMCPKLYLRVAAYRDWITDKINHPSGDGNGTESPPTDRPIITTVNTDASTDT